MATSTYKERVEGYVGTVTDTTLLNAWLNEAAQWVVSILPQELLANYSTSATIPAGGYDVGQKRVFEATHNGYPARRAHPWEYQRASVATSLFKADDTDPIYVIRGGKYLMLPSGGTNTIYILEPPALSYNDSAVPTLPHQADNLIVLHAAIQALLKNLQGRIGVMQNITVEISMVLPTPPGTPTFSSTDGFASVIGVTAINPFPDVPVFVTPTVSVTAVPADLDLSSITPPTPPGTPNITYSDATAGSISQTTIGSLPSAPTYVPPTAVDFSSLPLPDAVSVSANVPIPPSPPTFTYTDATAATISATTIAAFPAAPTYTKPTGSYTAAPASPDFSAITAGVSEPGAPSFTYDPAAVPIIGDIGLSALPSAPVFVPPTGLDFTGMDFPAALDTSSAVMPTAPDAPVFVYTAAVSTAATTAAAVEATSPPTFTWTPPDPPDTTVSVVPPTPPAAPSFTYDEALEPIIGSIGLEALPTAPTFVPPTSINLTGMDFPADLDTSSAVMPTAPVAPTFTYVDGTAATVSAATATEPSSPPTFSWSPPTAPTFSLSVVAPSPPGTPSLTWTPAEVIPIIADATLDLTTSYDNLTNATTGYINGEEDIELAMAKIQEIQSRIQKFNIEVDMVIKRAVADAQQQGDINKFNALNTFQAELQEHQLLLQDYSTKMEAFKTDVQAQAARIAAEVQIYVAESKNGLDNALGEFNELNTAYQMKVQKMVADLQAASQKALQDAQLSTSASMQNAAKELDRQVQQYAQAVNIYQADVQGYGVKVNALVAEHRQNVEAVTQERNNEIARFQAEMQGALGKFQGEIQQFTATTQAIISEAQIELELQKTRAQLTSNVQLQNAVQNLQFQVQEYQAILKHYETEMQGYAVTVQTKAQLIQAENQIYSTESQNGLQNALGEFNEENAAFQMRIQKMMGDLQAASQKSLQDAQLATQVSIQNALQDFQSQVQEYAQKVQLYQADVQGYGIKVNALVAEHRQNVEAITAERNGEIARFQGEMQGAISKLEGEVRAYQSQAQVVIAEAQVELDRVKTAAQTTTQTQLQNALQSVQTEIAEYQASISRYSASLQEYQLDISKEAQEYNLDLERTRIANNAEADEYQKDLYNELNEFNAEIQVYQLDVQKLMQQAQIDLQEALQQAQLDTQVDLENKIRDLNKQVQQYEQSIATFGAQVQAYQTDVTSQVQIGAQNLARIIDARRIELERFNTLSSNALNAFQAELAAYQVEVNKVMEQARLDQERLIQAARMDTDVAIQNKAKTLEAAIADYVQELQLYSASVDGYGREIEAAVSEYQANLQKVQVANTAELREFELKLQGAMNAFSAQLREFELLCDRETKQADLTQQRLIEQARLDAQIGLDNRGRQLNAAIAEYTAQLDRYRSEIQGYGADVQRKASEVQSALAREQMVTQTIMAQIKEVRTELQTALQVVAPGMAQEAAV